MATPCGPGIAEKGDILESEADQLAQRMMNLAKLRAEREGTPLTEALKAVAGEIKAEEKMMASINMRNAMLTIQAKRGVKDYVKRFKTMGEGLVAFLEGSNKKIPGARNSVDYQSKATFGKYFGSLVSQLEEAGVYKDFKDGANTLDIYKEMDAAWKKTGKSVTGNESAFKVAQIVDGLYEEMVARQNRAGAYIKRAPGYVTRQTHDQAAIRALGDIGNNKTSKDQSYGAWKDFILPLLDTEKTFKGGDANKILRNMHEGLYSGIHGPARDEANVSGVTVKGSLGDKVSAERLIWFKDAESAYKYNQALGTKNFKEAVIGDLHNRARSIALMENLGPQPEHTLDQIMLELRQEARMGDDAAKQMDSLKTWAIHGAMNELTGRNELPQNPTLSHFMTTAKTLLQLSKMGAVTLSSFADKAFLQTEMAFQGMSHLQTLGKQITGMLPRGPEAKKQLRLMGVAMDGLLGNAMSRYSSQSTVSGWAHTAQKWFFDLNGLNAWTDANKATAGELMSAHLGEHASSSFPELPDELRNVLSLYDITSSKWDALRSTVHNPSGSVGNFITPDQLAKIPDDVIGKLVVEDNKTATPANILRERDKLETALRTYFQDRIDIAIPTPGVAERRWSTMNTQAGTPLGEAVRLIMLFKSFPLTIMDKIVGREIYGHGADNMKQWLMHDHKGKFNIAMLMAMGTAAGYVSGAIRDTLKGREPKPLVLEDGKLNWAAVNDAAIRGGSLGIFGDVLLNDFDVQHNNFLQYAAGPVLGQVPQVMNLKSMAEQGKNIAQPAGKLLLDNTPYINLFYTRPVLDYFVLWNLEEMLSPGTLRRRESAVEKKNHQQYFLRPSETINR